MAYSRSTSLLGSLTSASAAGVSWYYVGTDGETAEQTAIRVAALKTMTETDSSSTNSSDSTNTSTVSHVYHPRLAPVKMTAPKADQIITGQVITVYDGDSCTKVACEDGVTRNIRLYGIDAPELDQDGGTAAREKLASLLLNKTVKITIPATAKDDHGRTVGKLTIDGTDVNLALVKSGNAWAYPQYLRGTDKATYIAAQTGRADCETGRLDQG